ncbi:hypothetical protein DLAC_09382 [Tieghemostelium lacteum]|uniref:PWWP domain-containing protein n=1 Tax=Tieghemostelium lacteum TaxID=361077 RepID=A0A151Z9X4_TIELA|nr:hypothetical protein DLAC_09382 [Tieghemostelium lacteum]|eukprot:KYQ90745.1 hypothetical protein DLAC_09382 [Tieghemostelium lacteum]
MVKYVWARSSELGYSWWPGKIFSAVDINDQVDQELIDKKLPNTSLVYLFGIHNFSWIKDNHIVEFSNKYIDQELPDSISPDYFNLALKEINLEIENQKSQVVSNSKKSNKNDIDNEDMISNNISNKNYNIVNSDDFYDDSGSDGYNSDGDPRKQQQQQLLQQQESQKQQQLNSEGDDESSHLLSNMKRLRDEDIHSKDNFDESDDDLNSEMVIDIEQSSSKPVPNINKLLNSNSNNNNKILEGEPSSKKNKISTSSNEFVENFDNENESPKQTQQHQSSSPSQSSITRVSLDNKQSNEVSPSLSSKRVLLIKPPRSPAINSSSNTTNINILNSPNRNKPVIISNSSGNSPSISCIPKPLNSPPSIRSVMPPSPMLTKLPTSPTMIPSKIPTSMMNTLQKKSQLPSPILTSSPSTIKSYQANNSNPNAIGPTPMSPASMGSTKIPITLSIPRFKKTSNSPSVSSSSPITQPPPISMSSPIPTQIPFQLPHHHQLRKNIFPPSPSLNNNFGRIGTHPNPALGRIPQSPIMTMPTMTPPMTGDSKLNLDEDAMMSIPPQFLPFFSIPPMSLANSPINFETVFTSPFSGKFSIKGTLDLGFQIECNIMGKIYQGYLSEPLNGVTSTSTAPQIPSSVPQSIPILPNGTQLNSSVKSPFLHPFRRNSLSATEGLNQQSVDYQNYLQFSTWFESFKQWQDLYLKSHSKQQQQQSNSSTPQNKQPSPQTLPTSVSSNSSTPMQTPKVNPTIIINNSNNKFENASQSSGGGSSISSVNNASGIDSHQVINISENQDFLQFKQNAFKKLEQYQKLQIVNLLQKQEETIQLLLETFEKDKEKAVSSQDQDTVSKLQIKLKDDQEKLQLSHKDQRSKLDQTHQQQASKFYRVVENQWILQQQKSHELKNSESQSPIGSPALAPFISPSPSPSPLLGSFNPMVGQSPSITPSLNTGNSSKLLNVYNTTSNNNNNNNNNNISNSNSNSSTTLSNKPSTSTSNSKDSNPPPLSLSSSSPPRSPNEILSDKDISNKDILTIKEEDEEMDTQQQKEKEKQKEKERECDEQQQQEEECLKDNKNLIRQNIPIVSVD